MSTAAVGVAQYFVTGPKEVGGLHYVNMVSLVIRFPFLPPIGTRVNGAGESWLVTGIECDLLPGQPEDQQVAGLPRVVLHRVGGDSSSTTGHGAAVLVRLLDEAWIGHPEGYEGELVPFPIVPRVGDHVYDGRRNPDAGPDGGAAGRPFVVKQVSHNVFAAAEPQLASTDVVVARDVDWRPPLSARRSPSAN